VYDTDDTSAATECPHLRVLSAAFELTQDCVKGEVVMSAPSNHPAHLGAAAHEASHSNAGLPQPSSLELGSIVHVV
jgi:hypothetical protein